MKKKKKLTEMTKGELASEKARVDKEWAKVNAAVTGEEMQEEEYNTPFSYNIFSFFIGGPNRVKQKNKQKGKPNVPPY